MIYFDNAATTYHKPIRVYRDFINAVRIYGGNPGRSGHFLSTEAARKVYEVREKIAELFHFQAPENVVFTQNATYAINLAIKSTIRDRCHVLISDIEHNAVFRPIEKMKEDGKITYSLFEVGDNTEEAIEKAIKDDTKYIVCSLASNVSGHKIPLSLLSKIREKYGIRVIADASQIAGHEDLDLERYPVDVLCAPGHKALFGIQGCGFALFKNGNNTETLIEGGSGNESKNPKMPCLLPERLEAGTLPTPAILSLGAGIDFVRTTGFSAIHDKNNELCEYCVNRIGSIKGVKILNPHGNAIVSFTLSPYKPEEIAEYLNKYEICVRSGYHCAPLIHKKLGTYESGCVRVSFSYYNTKSEIDRFTEKLNKIKSK